MYRKLSAPISVQLEITGDCNNNCIYCYNHWREQGVKSPAPFSSKELDYICDQIISCKVFKVTLTGGEPLLFWKNILTVIKRLSSEKIDVTLNSNLAMLTPEIAAELKRSGLKSILVTILSDDEAVHDFLSCRTGAWRKTIKGIKVAIAQRLNIGVNMVLLKQNHKSLYKTAEFVKSLGVCFFSATKASPALNSRNFDDFRLGIKELRESLEVLEVVKERLGMNVDVLECYPLCLLSDLNKFWHYGRRSCTAGITTCTIGFNGNVRPCSHSDMLYGSIFKEKLTDIFHKMSDWVEGKYIPDSCKSCAYLKMCSGGCRMEAKYRGDICGKDPYMTHPNDVISKAAETITISEISVNQKFFLKKNFWWRQEEFGAIISADGAETCLVNTDGLILLQQLPDRPFAIDDIARKIDSDPDWIRTFLSYLLRRRFILPVKKQ